MAAHRLLFAALLAAFGCGSASAQTLSRCLVASDLPDSVVHASGFSINAQGGYRYIQRVYRTVHYIIVDGLAQGPFRNIDYRDGSSGSVFTTYDPEHPNEPWYYTNALGAGPLYGPVRGKLMDDHCVHYNNCSGCVAITTWYRDSASCYVNGRLACRVRREDPDPPPPAPKPAALFEISSSLDDTIGGSGHLALGTSLRPMPAEVRRLRYDGPYSPPPPSTVAFSTNGRVLYVAEDQAGRKSIYLDGSLLHAGASRYDALRVNDRGDYLFVSGGTPGNDYQFLIHTPTVYMGR